MVTGHSYMGRVGKLAPVGPAQGLYRYDLGTRAIFGAKYTAIDFQDWS